MVAVADHQAPADPAGGVPGPGLAPAFRVDAVPTYKAHRVAGRIRTGAESKRFPTPLPPQVPMILDVLAAAGIATAGADGLRGRRRARHPRRHGTRRPGHRGQRRPRPAAGRHRRPRCRCGCCTWGADWPRPNCSVPPRSPSSTGCPPTAPARLRRTRRCCAATRPTGCPASRASARRPRPGAACSTDRSRRSARPPPTTPNPAGEGHARETRRRRRLSRRGAAGGAGRRRRAMSRCPATRRVAAGPPTRTGSTDWRAELRIETSVGRARRGDDRGGRRTRFRDSVSWGGSLRRCPCRR